jgi:arsenate reductase
MITVYGIRNCQTVKNAQAWLLKHNVETEFHDYKTKGITKAKLTTWCGQVGWERLVNTRGTTWRKLTDKERSNVVDEPSAIALMQEKTSVIKRPLLEKEGKVLTLGFDEHEFSTLFSKK